MNGSLLFHIYYMDKSKKGRNLKAKIIPLSEVEKSYVFQV